MDKEQMIQWIDNATYVQLLSKWRFAPAGNQFFTGDVGDYYTNKLREKRSEISDSEHISISKSIGW